MLRRFGKASPKLSSVVMAASSTIPSSTNLPMTSWKTNNNEEMFNDNVFSHSSQQFLSSLPSSTCGLNLPVSLLTSTKRFAATKKSGGKKGGKGDKNESKTSTTTESNESSDANSSRKKEAADEKAAEADTEEGSKEEGKEASGDNDNQSKEGEGGAPGGTDDKSASSSDTQKPTEEASATEAALVRIRDMKPRDLMLELDKFIVGQKDAKRAVAVALRNRWRRHQVAEDLREEIAPKNILMTGPTGVGKTEIARRLAKLTDAPFIKVEATKFTEVGFHGRDVDSIIEDLFKVAVSQTKQVLMRQNEEAAKVRAEDRILQALAGAASSFRDHLRKGALDNLEVTIEVQEKKEQPKTNVGEFNISVDIPAMMMGGQRKPRMMKKTLKIKDAMSIVLTEELEKMVDSLDVQKEALRACEEDGIVVIDEIDKIVTASGGYKGHQASAEGVQQDLLPLVEGTTITTKNNLQIKTDKILFICSGAFHSVKPSDMLAELQGRLPIRVKLEALSKDDFYRIITEPKYNLIKQHVAMMATEGVEVSFTEDAKWEIATVAAHVNSTVQNIGARRLITITEKVMEDISFDGPERKGEKIEVDRAYVKKAVEQITTKVDLTKYLL